MGALEKLSNSQVYTQHESLVMSRGCIDLHEHTKLVEINVSIRAEYYILVVLEQHILPYLLLSNICFEVRYCIVG